MVDSQSGGIGSDGPRSADDPLLAFAAVLRDMWSMGPFAVETVLAQTGLGESFKPYAESWLRAAAAFRDLAEAGMGAVATQSSVPSDDTDEPADMASLIAQSYLVAMVSSLRYWRRLTQTYGTHQSDILRTLLAKIADPNMSDEERWALTEAIRAYLREMGDVSVQEARVFQSELEKVAAAMAEAVGNADSSSDYRRRWKGKP